MQLPPELREPIYKMLLIFPKPGLARAGRNIADYMYRELRNRLGVRSRDDSNWKLPELQLSGSYPPGVEIAVESLAKTLAGLGVSEQIRHEALPVFYGCNTFQFASLDLLLGALQMMSHETKKQIRDLRVVVECYEPNRTSYQLQEFDELLPELCLENFVLICLQRTGFWTFCCGSGAEDRPASASETSRLDSIEGLGALVALAKRAKHLEISGDGFMGVWLREKITASDVVQGGGEEAGEER
ncbi:hypothetical protein BST61_g5723 [Cercospora zeina]